MKARIFILLTAALMFVASCAGQSDNTFAAKSFKGATVGEKIAGAQTACWPSVSIPCIIIIDPSLAAYPVGVMPSKCAQCSWIDYRNGAPTAAFGMDPYADVRAFGAKCDGVTDDSAAIQSALASGRPALIPAATCIANHPIYFGAGRIVGTNVATSILKYTAGAVTLPYSVVSASVAANVATITTGAAHGLQVNETGCVLGVSNSIFNGCFLITAVPSTTTFSYALITGNVSSSGGTAGMVYLLDGSKTGAGATVTNANYNAGYLDNLTVQCSTAAGLSGIFQFGDNGEAQNLQTQNCVDGYTAQEGYMSRTSHIEAASSAAQGVFFKDVPGLGNGPVYADSIWAVGYGTIGVHFRATPGGCHGCYAQNGGASALYGNFFEGDSGGGAWVRTPSFVCEQCVSEVGAQNGFRMRRYWVELLSPALVSGGPAADHFVWDDAWGTLTNLADNFVPAGGSFTFKSLGNVSGNSGMINLVGGNGTIEATHLTDFTLHGTQIGANNYTLERVPSLEIPSIKSTTGTRYVCIDTTGKIVSSATACSGT